jgi:hypothetical protein
MGITTINGKNHVLLIDSGIPTEPKLRTPVKEHRSFLTKIRISAYSLNIETGRYNSTPREQRICKFCPSNPTSRVNGNHHYQRKEPRSSHR